MNSMTIGIAGAGLLGRLLAWQLSRAGHVVHVFDPASGPAPQFRSDLPHPLGEGGRLQAAGFTAAGMLSPVAELDNAEPAVATLGWRSLVLWREITSSLSQRPFFSEQGSLLLAHRQDMGAAQRVLDRLRHAMQSADWQPPWERHAAGADLQALDAAQLQALEPAVSGPARAWMLPGEGQILSLIHI